MNTISITQNLSNCQQKIDTLHVSRLNSTHDTRPREYPLAIIIKEIQRGNTTLAHLSEDTPYRTLAQVTQRARDLRYQHGNKEAYDLLKSEMPQFIPAAVLSGRSEIHAFSHLVCLEWDGDVDTAHALMLGKQHPNVLAIWKSLSGNPKFLIPITLVSKDGDDLTRENYKHAWYSVACLFEEIGEADTSAMSPTQPQALCYDPDVYVNWEAVPVDWDVDEIALDEAYPNLIKPDDLAYAELPVEYHIAIQEMTWKTSGWGETSVPCPWGSHENDGWESSSNGTGIHKNGENDFTFHCFKCPKSVRYSEKSQTRHASIRLSHLDDFTPESETLETLRKAMPKGLKEWDERTRETDAQHMMILAYGAGTGKSTTAILNLTAYADISPTLELADEKYEKAAQKGINAMRHRSRNYNRKAVEHLTPETAPIGLEGINGAVPCVYPDACNALAKKNRHPSAVFCPSCPRFDECRQKGYLSQWDMMPKHEAIFFSWQDDFFSDPQYLSHIESIAKGKGDDFVLVLDEVDPATLPPKRGYTTDFLNQIADDYQCFNAGKFLDMLIKETARATSPNAWATAVKGVLDTFHQIDLDTIDIELEGIPVNVEFEESPNPLFDLKGEKVYSTVAHITYKGETRSCAVLTRRKGEKGLPVALYEMLHDGSLDAWISDKIYPAEGWIPDFQYPKLLKFETFLRLGFGSMDTPEAISELPKRLTNFTADLKAFIDSVNSDTPACHKGCKDDNGTVHDGWTYYLQPSMNARRGIIISASGVVDILNELYAHTDIQVESLEGNPPAWKPNNKLFQLSTGRYTPAKSLLQRDKDDNYKALALKPRGRELLQIITKEAHRGKPTLVVAPKDFTAEGDLTHEPEIAKLLAMPNVHVINHYHAEGMNEYDHCQDAFIFLFVPRPDEIERISSRIHRNKTLCFDREQITLEKAGVVLEKVWRYTDPRVQAVYDKECEKRLMQAITRLRQMIHDGKRVYLLTSEPVSGLPIVPILCTISDLKGCQTEHGTLDALEMYLDAKANRSITEATEQDGVSERTTYRRTEKQRKQTKAEKDKELLRQAYILLDKDYSQRATAKMLGISLGKLQSLLKAGDLKLT